MNLRILNNKHTFSGTFESIWKAHLTDVLYNCSQLDVPDVYIAILLDTLWQTAQTQDYIFLAPKSSRKTNDQSTGRSFFSEDSVIGTHQ